MIAVQLDTITGDGLAGLGDFLDDAVGPFFLDADHHYGGDIGVAARADQRAEMQIQVRAELQAAIRMRDVSGALDVMRHRFASSVGQIIQRQDDDVIAHTDAAILAAIAPEGCVAIYNGHVDLQFLCDGGGAGLTSAWS